MTTQSHPLEFIGILGTQDGSETHHAPNPPGVIDKSYVGAIARGHEYAGFDRALIGYFSASPDGFQVAAYAAQQTERLKFLLAHRPGFVAPTLAARQLASLDQFSDGRLAVHIITGGSDEEQARDGDFLTKEERYARTDEYLDILKASWTRPGPFDYDGKYYRVKGALAAVRPLQKPHIPIYFGGASPAAIRVAGKHADVYALWGESLAQVKEIISSVRAAAAPHGRDRHIRFSLSLRPVGPNRSGGLGARGQDFISGDVVARRWGGGAHRAGRWSRTAQSSIRCATSLGDSGPRPGGGQALMDRNCGPEWGERQFDRVGRHPGASG